MSYCPIDPRGLQPPLRTEEFETLFHLLKVSTVCQDLTGLLVYQIDTVDQTVLPHLAEQFDVLGYKGWLLADTEQKQRDLIKSAVTLHRKAGTPSAIIDALAAVGIQVSEIIENPGLVYDGTWNYSGNDIYGGKRWDRFIVNFEDEIPEAHQVLVDELINVWKNERSQRLVLCPNPLLYNQVWEYDGSETYDNCTDAFEKIGLLNYRGIFNYQGSEVYDGRTDADFIPLLQYNTVFGYDQSEFYDGYSSTELILTLYYDGVWIYQGNQNYDGFFN